MAWGMAGIVQVRTVENRSVCNAQGWDERRNVTIETGGSWDLDLRPGDTDQSVERVPARILIYDVTGNSSSGVTEVRLLIQKTLPDEGGAATQDTAWELRWKKKAPWAANPGGSRTVTMSYPNDEADLYKMEYVVKGKNVKIEPVYQSTIRVPFQITVQKN